MEMESGKGMCEICVNGGVGSKWHQLMMGNVRVVNGTNKNEYVLRWFDKCLPCMWNDVVCGGPLAAEEWGFSSETFNSID